MQDKKTIQSYINNFRRHLSRFLKPGIGVNSTIYPSTESGAILEFSLGEDIENMDSYTPVADDVNASLDTIEQHAFGGNLTSFRFSGTSTVLEPGRIILIKGDDDPDQWSEKAAGDDVQKIVNTHLKSKK